jgi:cytochrome c
MKKIIVSMLVAGTATLFAADGAALYSKCVSCHGKDGKMTAIPGKAIAGSTAADVEKKLKGYKDGTFGGAKKAMMAPNAKNLKDDEIKALATYIAGLKK